MFVQNYPHWRLLVKQIGKPLLGLFLLSVVGVVLDSRHHLLRSITIPQLAITVLAAALTILLGFRTNSAYARWWEARTLWGALVNNSRSLSRQATSLIPAGIGEPPPERSFARALIYRQIAFVHTVRCALRKQAPWDDLRPLLDDSTFQMLQPQQNVPAALLNDMARLINRSAHSPFLTSWQLHRFDQTLSELSNILGGCERIKNTPLPKPYDYYPQLLIRIYCVALPFVIVDEVGYLTPVVTLLVGFAFFVLNGIGKNLEDPFENGPYDVPMTALSRTIEINLRQSLGETILPPAIQPVDDILW